METEKAGRHLGTGIFNKERYTQKDNFVKILISKIIPSRVSAQKLS